MTLPNRIGYSVHTKGQHSPPPPSNNEQEVHYPPPPTYPFVNQPDVLKMVERGLGLAGQVQQASIPPYTMYSTSGFRPNLEHMDEEVQTRKNYVRQHKMLPYIVAFVNSAKKEGVVPSIDDFLVDSSNHIDFTLDDFLISQGLDSLDYEPGDNQDLLAKVQQLKMKYDEEVEKLNRVCHEFATNMYNLLHEHSSIRPVSEHEIEMKIHGIQQKFEYVKSYLKQNVCNTIAMLAKQSSHTKKKKRALPKKSAEFLSKWFFEHLNDPYPSEEEKAALASAGGLTLTQVNNWFGNKRIRYKKKCLAEEARRQGGGMNSNHPVKQEPEDDDDEE